uniref:Uncharacterized protein n=1 Tax=Parascaris univalens TaxID=6257 RepID=A0A914ZE77_PARUN
MSDIPPNPAWMERWIYSSFARDTEFSEGIISANGRNSLGSPSKKKGIDQSASGEQAVKRLRVVIPLEDLDEDSSDDESVEKEESDEGGLKIVLPVDDLEEEDISKNESEEKEGGAEDSSSDGELKEDGGVEKDSLMHEGISENECEEREVVTVDSFQTDGIKEFKHEGKMRIARGNLMSDETSGSEYEKENVGTKASEDDYEGRGTERNTSDGEYEKEDMDRKKSEFEYERNVEEEDSKGDHEEEDISKKTSDDEYEMEDMGRESSDGEYEGEGMNKENSEGEYEEKDINVKTLDDGYEEEDMDKKTSEDEYEKEEMGKKNTDGGYEEQYIDKKALDGEVEKQDVDREKLDGERKEESMNLKTRDGEYEEKKMDVEIPNGEYKEKDISEDECKEQKEDSKDSFMKEETPIFEQQKENKIYSEEETSGDEVDDEDMSERNAAESVLKQDIADKFLVPFPPELFCFWEDVQKVANCNRLDNACDALKTLKNLRLVGVFKYLAGTFGEVPPDNVDMYLVKDRFATDLPEMQTIAVYDNGRFAYWRDSPYEDRPLLVHVSNENKRFPKVEIVGERDPTHMVAYLARSTTGLLPGADELLTKLAHLDDPLGKTGANYSDIRYDTDAFLFDYDGIVESAKKNREEVSFCCPSHGMGIIVPGPFESCNSFGFYTSLRSLLQKVVAECSSPASDTMEMTGFLQTKLVEAEKYMSDNLYIRNALAFGQDLWMSNYAIFTEKAARLLNLVYEKLGYNAFQRILRAHLQIHRREGTNVDHCYVHPNDHSTAHCMPLSVGE